VLRAQLARSDLRPVTSTLTSGGVFWTNTKETSLTHQVVPMPAFMFSVKGSGALAVAGSGPAPLAAAKPPVTLPAKAPEVADVPIDDTPEPAEPSERFPTLDHGALSAAETREETNGASLPAPETTWQSNETSGNISLSIDSLPNLQLTEAIPVLVVQLGDNLFTATVDAVRVTGTGDTLSDALIDVKEHIEILYEKLIKNTRLDEDEKEHLQYLQAHILSLKEPQRAKRGLWR
jgi:hypothetical protein